MKERSRWPLANLVYAAICAVVGVPLVLIGSAGEGNPLAAVGGIALFVGFLYLLTGLFGLARVLTDSDEPQ